MITQDKITDIFCMVDEFSKKFDMEIAKGEFISSNGIRRRHRNASLSDGEIMTILIVFHFGTFANFKHYYLHYIRVHLHQDFPDAVSYNRFVELESRVFFKLMFFLKLYYCCPINSIKYKNVVFGHCVFSGRVLFYSSMPPQKIDNW